MKRPLILITPRLESSEPTLEFSEPQAPEEGVADVFLDAIIAAGGMPLIMAITDDEALIDNYIAMADGVAIPGGPDVDPVLWGVDDYNYPERLSPRRDAFEIEIVKRALAADVPIFATCRGMQLLNVALGGTLDMDVPGRTPRAGKALWRHDGVLLDVVHPVEVMPDSLMFSSVGEQTLIQVNSAHHCCVDKLGRDVRVVAEATDGIPEAIEVTSARFALGVQWHPEYTWERVSSDTALWDAFITAAQATHQAARQVA
ncbi:gamma-glutamyl-gamma-aminobutyrate hydrolase family protein [Collinsella sp. zg1085]|uniref:gamma-glutamyl-gamma-aminobutyrate hydrolase family protein n=1 Tax=Collinsella sp. zg1085 TaxID=2844380 RepID=UPI001C0DCA41|nr:gamma-glutamyl-gamma-aminobutyrate hydrolase family protein [Collinsella sp. zg1085]QWT17320.1 gamma-glutamyl-gamma-aminobutyrate hydrolase family protein [Collinsella sp. zg1085]